MTKRLESQDVYRFYMIDEQGVIVAKTSSQSIVLFIACLIALSVFLLLGYSGVIIVAIAVGISYFIATARSSRLRELYRRLPIDELRKRKEITILNWSDIEFARVDGRQFRFSARGRRYKMSIKTVDLGELDRLLGSTSSMRALGEPPLSRRPSVAAVRVLQVAAFAGAIMMALGNLFVVGFNIIYPWNGVFQLGLALLLTSGTVYCLLRPSVMSPIPPVVGYLGLLILNLSIAASLAIQTIWLPLVFIEGFGILITSVLGMMCLKGFALGENYEVE